jgi:hypothetical protein
MQRITKYEKTTKAENSSMYYIPIPTNFRKTTNQYLKKKGV